MFPWKQSGGPPGKYVHGSGETQFYIGTFVDSFGEESFSEESFSVDSFSVDSFSVDSFSVD